MNKLYRFILCAFMCVTVIFTCSAVTSAAPKIAKVKSVKVSSVAADKITLKWKKVSGVTGYRIYRYSSKKDKYVYVGRTKKVSYTDDSLSAGKTYKYKVRAYKTKNKKNTYGAYSSVVKGTTNPKKVKGLKATYVGTSNVKLSWNKSTGATGYEVFMYDFDKDVYVSVGTVSKTSCALKKLKQNTRYRVRVVAFHKKNGKTYGVRSSALNFRTVIPEVNSIRLSDVTENSYNVKWNSVKGADGYYVYRYDSNTGEWKNVTKTSSTVYSVKNLKPGTSYLYRVRAYVKNGSSYNYGGYSAQLKACTLPKAPTELSAATDNKVIALNWKGNGKGTGYEVDRFNNEKNTWENIARTTVETYTDSSLTKAGTYTYRVRAYVEGEKIFTTTYTASVSIVFESTYVRPDPYGDSVMSAAGVLGFLYDPAEMCFYTSSDPWQRKIGYTEIFDILAPGIAISYDTARVKFDYGDKDWMIQLWKGQYGFLFYGAEIGVYTKPKDRDIDHYDCASDDEKLMMSMDFYNSGVKKFTRPYGSYWWCTGFTPGNVLGSFHNLRVDARITVKDYTMLSAVKNALDSEEVISEGVIYSTNGLNIYLSYQ